MPAQRGAAQTGFRARGFLCAAALALAGCGLPQVFDLYPAPEGPALTGPWPTLIDTVRRHDAAGAPLDPRTGAGVVAALDVEAALSQSDSARVAAPVVQVEPLRRAAAEARAGR